MENYKFVKTNTKIILWDYDITCDAFVTACESLEEGEMTDEEIALELYARAFKHIWQTRDLTDPLLISSKWYSHNLHNFLFNCCTARDLSDEELEALIGKIKPVSEELCKVKWEDIQSNGSWIWYRHKIFQTIQNVDEILDGQ